MKLQNEFTTKTRQLFMDAWRCFDCGSNGNKRGGLSLHHITGRDSNSPFNAAPLCGICHEKVGHTDEEEKFYFANTIAHLIEQGFKPGDEEDRFIKDHMYLVHDNVVYNNIRKKNAKY